MAEVTSHFKKNNLESAFCEVLEKVSVSETNNSDLGRVFYQFYAERLSEITSRTVILILGDAKNNWRPDERLAFKEIARRAKKGLLCERRNGDSSPRLLAGVSAA